MAPKAAKSSKAIAYFRVSTDRQGKSGLGLQAQQEAVEAFIEATGLELLATYTEVESGKRNDRPELAKALKLSRLTGATVLIAKLDRLSRNAAFLLTLQESHTRFICVDMPEANALTIGILALVAQAEREAISKRTTDALAAAKKRGTKLGNPRGAEALRRAGKGNDAAVEALKQQARDRAIQFKEVIEHLREEGASSLQQLADGLNSRGMPSPRGGKWHPSSVRLLVQRIDQYG